MQTHKTTTTTIQYLKTQQTKTHNFFFGKINYPLPQPNETVSSMFKEVEYKRYHLVSVESMIESKHNYQRQKEKLQTEIQVQSTFLAMIII